MKFSVGSQETPKVRTAGKGNEEVKPVLDVPLFKLGKRALKAAPPGPDKEWLLLKVAVPSFTSASTF